MTLEIRDLAVTVLCFVSVTATAADSQPSIAERSVVIEQIAAAPAPQDDAKIQIMLFELDRLQSNKHQPLKGWDLLLWDQKEALLLTVVNLAWAMHPDTRSTQLLSYVFAISPLAIEAYRVGRGFFNQALTQLLYHRLAKVDWNSVSPITLSMFEQRRTRFAEFAYFLRYPSFVNSCLTSLVAPLRLSTSEILAITTFVGGNLAIWGLKD